MAIQEKAFLLGTCVVLLSVGLPTVLMLSLALMPSFCALFVDRTPGRYAGVAVSALNLAGAWPFLLTLWTTGHTMPNAMKIILNPQAWLIIYSAAAAGWLLYLGCPKLVSLYVTAVAGRRLSVMAKEQKKLIEEWGPEVAGPGAAS